MRNRRRGGLIISLAGAVFTLSGAGMMAWEAEAWFWPAAAGTLLEAGVKMDRGEEGMSYFPEVRYSYKVEGKAYQGRSYTRQQLGISSRSIAERAVDRVREEQRARGEITVWYDPHRPEESVLDARVTWFGFAFSTFGLALIFLGLALSSGSIRRRIVCGALCGGAFLGILLSFGIIFLLTREFALDWKVVAGFGACLAGAYLLATRHPSYVHAPEMALRFSATPGAEAAVQAPGGLWGALRSLPQVWEELSSRVKGTLETNEGKVPGLAGAFPTGVSFSHQGTRARLEMRLRKDSEDNIWDLALVFVAPAPASFRCRIMPQGPFQGGDPELGWSLFDDQFLIKTSDEARCRRALSPAVQEEILRLTQWLRDLHDPLCQSDRPELKVEDGQVELKLSGLLSTTEALMRFYQSGARILDEVRKAL